MQKRHNIHLLATLLGFWLLHAGPARAQQSDGENQPDCLQLVPGAVATTTTPVTLNLRIVIDGVPMAQATQALSDAQRAYTPLNITVNPSYEFASFSTRDSAGLIAEVKARFGGRRPSGTDAVYVITAKDLVTGNNDNSVAGQADCIGGVANATTAFAVGEALADDPVSVGPATLLKLNAAKVLAHELGHLLGAQHHYANCGEASGGAGGDAPCTLLFNDVSLQALKFSSLNSSVARGAAQTYVGGANSGGSSSSGGSSTSSSSGSSVGSSSTSGGAGSGGSSGAMTSSAGDGGGGAFSLLLVLPLLLLRVLRGVSRSALRR